MGAGRGCKSRQLHQRCLGVDGYTLGVTRARIIRASLMGLYKFRQRKEMDVDYRGKRNPKRWETSQNQAKK